MLTPTWYSGSAAEIASGDCLLSGTGLNRYTYRQLADTVLQADFLSESEKRMILAGNALNVFEGLT
jgi:hypothetical protein